MKQILETDPEAVVQKQLDAYNAHDVATYADDASLFEHPATLLAAGTGPLRKRFSLPFQEPNLHARLLKRMVMGSFVVDHELVMQSFPDGPGTMELIAAYEARDGRIANAWFLSGPKTSGAS